jgi:hypothetical protein
VQRRTSITVHYTYTTVQTSICGVIRNRNRIKIRISLEKQYIHIARDRSTYAEVRTYSTHSSVSFVFVLFPCYAMPCLLPCITSSLPALPRNAMPCHALAMPCHALLRLPASSPQPGRAHPPSLRLTSPQYPIQPSRRSAHKQDFTLVSELLQPSVLCPVLPGLALPACLVPQK